MFPQSHPFLAYVLLALICVSLAGAGEPAKDVGSVFFETHIRPLFAKHCYQCHSQRARELHGELLLDSRAGWIRGGQSGPSVIPGDVEASLLIGAVRYADSELRMPPVRQLPPEDIARLEQWIRMGAPGLANNESVAVENPSDPIAGKNHWAFRPLGRHVPPDVKTVAWPRMGIDQFVAERLETQGLKPVPDARPLDLARRAYIQLTGLPPTSEQLQSFISDHRPNAFEDLVDRLLCSPRFGERWGRHWLDLARYADSNGLDENFLFREAWRYRNWVIDSVSADLPYDRFVLEQVAGDLLPFDSLEQRDRQRIAAGFLVIGPKVLLGNTEKNQRMEVADEQMDSIGRAILGQTLGCARCHDHKFDPFPTADYYALAGIFASTSVMESRYMLGQQRLMERLVGLGASGSDADDAYEKYWLEQPNLTERKKKAESELATLRKERPPAPPVSSERRVETPTESCLFSIPSLADRIAAQEALIAELKAALANPPKIPPRAMIPSDVAEPADEHIRLSGQFDRHGELVSRGYLSVLCDGERIDIPAKQSGRLAFGQWLVDGQRRSGQLAARVLANRIWHHLIGRGLVRTTDSFGRTGEPPTHPELLDYLANRLIDSGWSVKKLVREIVLSRTFALSSHHDAANEAIDPDNRWLSRAHRRRLDPEALRDAMLLVAGQLDLSAVESTVWYLGDQATAVGANKVRRRTDFPCRSVYLPVIRNDLPELFEVFDFANPHATTGARPNTTVPTQGLFMLNDEMVMATSEAIARRILTESTINSPETRIDRMFELIHGTSATAGERSAIQSFVEQTQKRLSPGEPAQAELRALTVACHAVIASSRFQFLE